MSTSIRFTCDGIMYDSRGLLIRREPLPPKTTLPFAGRICTNNNYIARCPYWFHKINYVEKKHSRLNICQNETKP